MYWRAVRCIFLKTALLRLVLRLKYYTLLRHRTSSSAIKLRLVLIVISIWPKFRTSIVLRIDRPTYQNRSIHRVVHSEQFFLTISRKICPSQLRSSTISKIGISSKSLWLSDWTMPRGLPQASWLRQVEACLRDMGMTGLVSTWAMARRRSI